MRVRALSIAMSLLLAVGCGAAPTEPAKSSESRPSRDRDARADAGERRGKGKGKRRGYGKGGSRKRAKAKRVKRAAPPPPYPVRCAKKKGECLPDGKWVAKLCEDIYPDLALHLFGPKTPWKRLYMLKRAEPFNAYGGVSLVGDPMRPGEEVIALQRRDNSGRIQIGDTAGYDVLRWNGACATVHDGDFSTEMPNTVRHARIEWRRLGLGLRLALEKEPNIGEVYETRREKCRGKTMGRVTEECETYDGLLTDEVVRYVREGGKLPRPEKVP